MTYEEALSWIHSRLKFGSRPGLIRVEQLLARLGNPHIGLPAVHIGGTNGKGSTVAFLNGLLLAQGLKVGTFTSPFITKFNERISLNNQPIPDEDLIKLVEKIQPHVLAMDEEDEVAGITEFEIITVMMFLYFKEAHVDVALIEVGLGGLYDSTNVLVAPLLSVITTIGMDHMDILGETIEKIAAQKAGIIKPEVPVVVGSLPKEALAVMKQTAKIKQAPCYVLGEDFSYQECSSEQFDFDDHQLYYKHLTKTLMGYHQFANASLALKSFLLLAEPLGLDSRQEKIQAGLNLVTWPGRMEVMSQEPLIIIDGAHNEPAGVELVNNLTRDFSDKTIKLLFAAINTKDIQPMLANLRQVVAEDQLFFTTFDYPRALALESYRALGVKDSQLCEDWKTAVLELKKGLSDDTLLVITGSLYFISDVRKKLLEEF